SRARASCLVLVSGSETIGSRGHVLRIQAGTAADAGLRDYELVRQIFSEQLQVPFPVGARVAGKGAIQRIGGLLLETVVELREVLLVTPVPFTRQAHRAAAHPDVIRQSQVVGVLRSVLQLIAG